MRYYNGSTFVLVKETHSWLEAVGRCQSLGGHLAVADDRDDLEVFQSMLADYRAGGGSETRLWLDGSDEMHEGTWFCQSRAGVCPFFSWASNQPDNHNGNENCLALYDSSDNMNDLLCSAKLPLICEFE